MDNKIHDNIINLKERFEEIKKLGYIDSINSSSKGNAGLTFERLIGKENDNFQIADYQGIEIKVKSYKTNIIRFFSLVPSNNFGIGLKNLRNSYGINDNIFNAKKILHCYAITTKKVRLKSDYKIQLEINYNEERLYIIIYDKHDKLLEKSLYWDFEDIIVTLNQKLNILSLVSYNKKYINNFPKLYFYKIEFYKMKSIIIFFKLIEQGIIYLQFNLGIYRSGNKIGQEHDNGIYFCINMHNLAKIYKIII